MPPRPMTLPYRLYRAMQRLLRHLKTKRLRKRTPPWTHLRRWIPKPCNKPARPLARKAMRIAADICVYTNENTVIEILERR